MFHGKNVSRRRLKPSAGRGRDLRAIRRAKKRVGLDLCEVSTEWDANVGARLLYKMIGFALLTHATTITSDASDQDHR